MLSTDVHEPLLQVLHAVQGEDLITQCNQLPIENQKQVMEIVQATVKNDIAALFELIQTLSENGIEPNLIIQQDAEVR